MTAVFGDDGPDGRHVPDLMTQWLRVVAMQRLLAMAAGRWFAIVDGVGVIDESALDFRVSGLTARFVVGRRLGWGAFEGRRVGGRWLGRVCRIQVEALLEFSDLLLQVLQLPLISLDEDCDRCPCGRRDLVPKFSRDGWLRTHAADLQTELTEGKVGPGTSTKELTQFSDTDFPIQ
jgi:hypothetical protein